MSFSKMIAVSQRTIDIASGSTVFEKNGIANVAASDLSKTLSEWIAYIETAAGWTANDETGSEYIAFSATIGDTLKIKDEQLALLLGFPYDTLVYYSGGFITATLWGNARLIIQGATPVLAPEESMYQGSPIYKVPFKNNTVVLAGFKPQNDYAKRNDKEAYTIKCTNLDKKVYDNNVKDFYHYSQLGGIFLFGIEFRIDNDKLFYLILDSIDYSDLEERYQTVDFSFNISTI